MDNETFTALLLSLPGSIGVLLLGIYTVRKNRQTGAEQNEINDKQADINRDATDIHRFEALIEGYEKSRLADAARITRQDERINKLETRVGELTDLYNTQGRDLRLIKTAVQRWFARIWAAWPHDETPMPMPSTDELALLEITIPTVRVAR